MRDGVRRAASRNRKRVAGWRPRAIVPTLLVAGGLFLLGASPAEAKDEFERGFKDELGRIAAYEAVHLGRHVLGGLVPYGHRYPGHGPPRHVRHRRHHRYESWGPPYGRAVGHRHRHHGAPCGCCGYESYEEYVDDYGSYERYERRYGPGRVYYGY